MKTLNLNKLTILISLFLISVIFSTGANATCKKDADGKLITASGDSDTQVIDVVTGQGEQAFDQCSDTPEEYEITFYKLGICTATTIGNDLSSCQYIVNDDAGITHVIKKNTSGAMAIPKFAIDPGTYPYMVVVLSSKLGIKHSFQSTNAVDGSSGDGNGGTYCWTAVAGPSSYTGEETGLSSAHGTIADGATKLIDCGTAAGTAIMSYEVITKLSDDDDDETESCNGEAWGANGDRQTFSAEGTGASSGIPTVSLLTTANAFAASCIQSHKILWTTSLTTPYTVTDESVFELKMKTTDSVSIDFSSSDGDNDIIKMGADPVKLFLTVTG
jgi:hypothetical protein